MIYRRAFLRSPSCCCASDQMSCLFPTRSHSSVWLILRVFSGASPCPACGAFGIQEGQMDVASQMLEPQKPLCSVSNRPVCKFCRLETDCLVSSAADGGLILTCDVRKGKIHVFIAGLMKESLTNECLKCFVGCGRIRKWDQPQCLFDFLGGNHCRSKFLVLIRLSWGATCSIIQLFKLKLYGLKVAKLI